MKTSTRSNIRWWIDELIEDTINRCDGSLTEAQRDSLASDTFAGIMNTLRVEEGIE